MANDALIEEIATLGGSRVLRTDAERRLKSLLGKIRNSRKFLNEVLQDDDSAFLARAEKTLKQDFKKLGMVFKDLRTEKAASSDYEEELASLRQKAEKVVGLILQSESGKGISGKARMLEGDIRRQVMTSLRALDGVLAHLVDSLKAVDRAILNIEVAAGLYVGNKDPFSSRYEFGSEILSFVEENSGAIRETLARALRSLEEAEDNLGSAMDSMNLFQKYLDAENRKAKSVRDFEQRVGAA
ncbi:hypothetical protein HYX10_05860 [Candidatus Woesearchaeota archaeon]|nr:hypothetical protein [Candidatus Woesearchaeota archaeon]